VITPAVKESQKTEAESSNDDTPLVDCEPSAEKEQPIDEGLSTNEESPTEVETPPTDPTDKEPPPSNGVVDEAEDVTEASKPTDPTEPDTPINPNGLSKQVHLGSRLRAEYLAGEPKAIAFYDVSNASGLEMDFTKNVSRGKIVCIVEAYKAWEALGDKLYGDMLNIIVRAWNKQPESLHREIIGGMASFLKKHSSAYDSERLVKCLSKVSPIHIVREGNLLAVSGTAKYAEQIVKLYNKNMKKKLA